MKILFICKDRGSYKHGKFGLWNSASLVINAIKSEHEARLIAVVDGNAIDKEVYTNKPDMVILEAIWVTPDKVRELQRLHPNVVWLVRIHSKASFLANEGVAFQWINGYMPIPNVIVSVNNEEFNTDMNKIGYSTAYLPNIYTLEYNLTKKVSKYDTDSINIGCFGALRPMKNQVPQAIAAIRFADSIGKKLRFHINHASEGGMENVLKNLRAIFDEQNTRSGGLRHALVEHEWMPHNEFCQIVANMDLGLQVSLTESFNIVSADFVFANVPIIVSKEIKFINSIFKCHNDTEEMIRALYIAYYGKSINLQYLNKILLNKHNVNAIKTWKDFLNETQARQLL